MKKIMLIAAITGMAAITGCTGMSSMVREAAKDPAAVHIQVTTIYGTLTIDRANPGTNQMQVGGSGGITTKPSSN